MRQRPQDLSSGARRVMRGRNLRGSRHVGRRSGPFINFCFNGGKIPLPGRSSSKAPDGSLWRLVAMLHLHNGAFAGPHAVATVWLGTTSRTRPVPRECCCRESRRNILSNHSQAPPL